MNILEAIGAVTLLIAIIIAIAWTTGYLKVSLYTKDDGDDKN
jgi:hypothetical protein